MKRNRIFLASTVGILLLILIPAIQAKTTKRPIDDWIYPDPENPYSWNYHIFAWGAPNGLAVWPHNYGGDWVPIFDCSYDGYIIERELNDGDYMITVFLHVSGVPFKVTSLGGIIFEGMMHYTFTLKFTLDPESYPLMDDGMIEYAPLGCFMFPGLWPELFASIQVVSLHINGAGKGTFVSPYDGSSVGDPGTMKVNQIGMAKVLPENNPNYHPEYSPSPTFWPVEIVVVH